MNFTLKLNPSVTLKEMDGQTVLFSKETGDFFGLNPTATYLVQKLLGSTFEVTAQEAAVEFKVDESLIRADLREVVTSLTDAGLATEVPVQ